MRDQAEKLRQMAQGHHSQTNPPPDSHPDTQARVVTVTSGKGGVGKTNFTVNLALAMANLGQRVLIIDADLGLANVEFVLGCSPQYSLLSLLNDGCRLDDVAIEGPLGIKFISGGSGLSELANLNEVQVRKILSSIMLFDAWADVILIDTGAGIHKNVINFVMAADEVIIITTPEPTAIADAYAMMKAYATNRGHSPLKLVVNRVLEAEEGQLVVDKLVKVAQRFLGLTIASLGFVYEDPNVLKAVKRQVPLLLASPDAISSRCIEHIAQKLIYGREAAVPSGIKGFFSRFIRMVR